MQFECFLFPADATVHFFVCSIYQGTDIPCEKGRIQSVEYCVSLNLPKFEKVSIEKAPTAAEVLDNYLFKCHYLLLKLKHLEHNF